MVLVDALTSFFLVKVELVIPDNKAREEKVAKQDNRNYQVKVFQFIVL